MFHGKAQARRKANRPRLFSVPLLCNRFKRRDYHHIRLHILFTRFLVHDLRSRRLPCVSAGSGNAVKSRFQLCDADFVFHVCIRIHHTDKRRRSRLNAYRFFDAPCRLRIDHRARIPLSAPSVSAPRRDYRKGLADSCFNPLLPDDFFRRACHLSRLLHRESDKRYFYVSVWRGHHRHLFFDLPVPVYTVPPPNGQTGSGAFEFSIGISERKNNTRHVIRGKIQN